VRRLAVVVALLAVALPASAGADPVSKVTLNVLKPSIVFGDRIALRGAVAPVAAGVRVLLTRQGKTLAHARTDSSGLYTVRMRPARGGVWRARVGGANVSSAPVTIQVSPQLSIETSSATATAFVGAPVVVHAKPRTTGKAKLTILRLGKPVAELTVPIGKKVVAPLDGTGLFALRAELGASVARARVIAGARTLSVGSTGPDVVALAPGSSSSTSTPPGPPPPSARSSTTALSRSRRRVGSSAPVPSTTRPGGRSRGTRSRRLATAARARTSR
jgi:hypothetical protein